MCEVGKVKRGRGELLLLLSRKVEMREEGRCIRGDVSL